MNDRFLKRPKEGEDNEDMHPVSQAAWRGYYEYKRDMARRSTVPAWRELSIRTMATIAACALLFLVLLDQIIALLE